MLIIPAACMVLAGCARSTAPGSSPVASSLESGTEVDSVRVAPSFNFALAAELLALAADDQRYEHLVMNQDPAIREPGFMDRKAALQRERSDRCKVIFAEHGFPSIDMVGTEASSAFWLLVQHADADVPFQEAVLAAMEPLVSIGQADGSEFAYLTDRVRVNTGRAQLYGTQMRYDAETGRPSPKPLARPAEVDKLRAAAGLEPLYEYVNGVAVTHFRMNQASLEASGITEPWVHPVGYSEWGGPDS
ncbi:MAG: DUF6624 domain-containing protein [Phycisphaerales bacterium]